MLIWFEQHVGIELKRSGWVVVDRQIIAEGCNALLGTRRRLVVTHVLCTGLQTGLACHSFLQLLTYTQARCNGSG